MFQTLTANPSISVSLRYARTVGARHFHTSAKQNRGIEDLFLDLAQQMMATADKKAKSGGGGGSRADGAGGSGGGGRNNIRIVDDIEVRNTCSGLCNSISCILKTYPPF